MSKLSKIIIIILLSSFIVFGGEGNDIKLSGINIKESDNNLVVELEFNDIVSFYTSNLKGNNLIVDITDCSLNMLDLPIKPKYSEISLVQPMQLKKNPNVARVIMVLNSNNEYKSTSNANKVLISLKKNIDVSDSMENSLEHELEQELLNDYAENKTVEEEANNINFYDKNEVFVKNISEKTSKDENINFNFSGMTIKEIFETVSNLTGLNIIVDGDVKERNINLYIQDLPVNEVLDLVVTSTGLNMHRFNYNTYIVSEKDKAKTILNKKDQTIYRLKNAVATEVIELINDNKILSKKIKAENLSVDERINAILAYDTPENLKLLENIIKDFDKKNGQVTIELHLVEMKREDLNNFGFSFDDYPLTPQNFDILNIPAFEINTKLEALESKDRANILSSPKIRVVHKKKATIEIGDEIPVPYYTFEEANKYVNTQGNGDNIRVIEPLKKFEKAKVGISLGVTPYVHDNKEVSLDLDIDVSDLIKVDSDGQLYTSTRNTKTYVRLKNRETAILGGLIKQEERNENSKVPGFDKIPILRSLFKKRRSTQKNMEMIMFITPYFVGDENIENSEIVKNTSEGNISQENINKTNQEYYNVVGELKKISE